MIPRQLSLTLQSCYVACYVPPGNKSEVWEDVICSRLPASRQPSQPSLLTTHPSFLSTNLCDKTMVQDESHAAGVKCTNDGVTGPGTTPQGPLKFSGRAGWARCDGQEGVGAVLCSNP